jgi:hypothetical protein
VVRLLPRDIDLILPLIPTALGFGPEAAACVVIAIILARAGVRGDDCSWPSPTVRKPMLSSGTVARVGDDEMPEVLAELLSDEAASASRIEVCETIAGALSNAGRILWVTGYMLGPDRVEGDSPYGFGKDDTVGLATVAQVGGELARGAIALFSDGNLYGGSALMRQLVEVQYLAAAFAEQDAIAAEWLRADRDERLSFWTAGKLRKRAGGRFLAEDYWDHCDRGGHPTRDGLPLLPDHRQVPVGVLWVDLAGHLRGIWGSVVKAIEVRRTDVPDEAMDDFSRVAVAVDRWLEADGLYHALTDPQSWHA